MKDAISNANFPRDHAGRVYHIGVKYGEVANRILTVGDPARAKAIAQWLDTEQESGHKTFVNHSHRGFLTITGRYKGVPVSIMAIGMGNPMMDFFVRETRAIVTGTMAIVRFGSCGALNERAPCGSVIVPRGGYCIRRNLDYFCDQPVQPQTSQQPYLISGVFNADADMSERLADALTNVLAPLPDVGPIITGGLNADGCSFYSAQGRQDPAFWDDNELLIKNALVTHPDTDSLEMETSMLYHLANCARGQPIRATGCMQAFFNRVTNDAIRPETVQILEPAVGRACLDALVDTKIEGEMDPQGTVWERLPAASS